MREGRVAFGSQEEIVFGRPAAAAAEISARYGAERVFVLASGTLARETGLVREAADALGRRFAGLFDRMPAHTPRGACIAAAEAAREAGADLLLTIGGGSVTDGAKAVSLILSNDISEAAGMDRLRTGESVRPPAVRQISVPTTLSAGEFSALCGVTDERTRAKELFTHPLVVPRAVILDPAATVHTPEWLFLSTGVRAVDHAAEGIASLEGHPYGDAQGEKALAHLSRGLRAVKADPADLGARLDCQVGAWLSMGPLASGVPMGASHGIGYVLGARHGVPHGHTSCVMLPAAMRWNLSANSERQTRVAAALGRPGEGAAESLADLIAAIGMPRTLREVGVAQADFDAIAEGAMRTPWVPRNPRPIRSPADVREILELAA